MAFAGTSTQVIGTYQDLGGNLISSGQVIFTLQPPIDAAMAGNARFSSQSISCSINGATVASSQAVRSSNVTTITFVSNPFIAGDVIEVEGMADSTMNGTWTVATASSTQLTYSNPGSNSTSGGATVSALRNQAATGPCALVQNTALVPQGTSYKACTYPSGALSGCFTFYATQSQQDLSTTAPLPSQQATYPFVDVFSNQTIAGAKTFSGLVNLLGGFDASAFTSSSANPALTGVVNLAAGDKACWRNQANTADICIAKDANDQLVVTAIASATSNPATSGVIALASGDTACWRNAANSADVCISKNASDQFVLGALASTTIDANLNTLLNVFPTTTLKKGTGGGAYSTTSTSYVDIDATNLAYTVTIPTGWKLIVSASGFGFSSTAAANIFVSLFDSATLVETSFTPANTTSNGPWALNWVIAGNGASHTVKLQFKTGAAADAANIANSSSTQIPTMVCQLVRSN
ncbi:MAG TPA: hypothetical protein VKU44_06855 [Terriglobia bacterium]|nr:hypothetical protein [Terriglobia bacterium]